MITNPHKQCSVSEMICLLADKYRLRSSLSSDEAALPPSKWHHWAQEAMFACVEAVTALVEPVATGVTGKNDAYNISADGKSYTKFLDNDKKSVKGNEECVKIHTLIQKEPTETIGSKKPVV